MNFPQHLAVIMDGNGRWAEARSKPRLYGHVRGVKRVRDLITFSSELGIPYLSLYAFSMENWQRPKEEVSHLMKILVKFLKSELTLMMKQNIRLMSLGDISYLPDFARTVLLETIEKTKNNSGMTLSLALSYSSRDEILRSVRKLSKLVRDEKIDLDAIDAQTFNSCLDSHYLPDPDLLIRTSGESRLSNFMLWQMAYTEIYITKVLWPDFTRIDLMQALDDYSRRERRFGKVSTKTLETTEARHELN